MGDMFTKIVLTVVNDYSCRMAGVRVYSLVGDDLIALSVSKETLHRVLEELRKSGMKISEDDTFISSRFAYYCEEGTLVPQKASHVPRVSMRRGQDLCYLDYPRIRLMIPTQSETDAYSSSNIGRFTLLGKESKWVQAVNGSATDLFARAVLIQHLVVPQDADTLCPYTPAEIGGDGAFPHSSSFLKSVVESHSRGSTQEVRFRMHSLLTGKVRHKFVRSDKFDGAIHKHHLLLPKLEGLRDLLPEESVVIPSNDASRMLINSVRFPHLEKPETTFLRLCREAYYKALFDGKEPPVPTFDVDRYFPGGRSLVPLSWGRFRDTWMNPGFTYRNLCEYLVDRTKLVPVLTTGLGMSFNTKDSASDDEMFGAWVRRNLTLVDQSVDDLVRYVCTGEPLIPRVADRLSLYFESDAYIVSQIDVDRDDDIVIVTRDIKLCHRVRDLISHGGSRPASPEVHAVDPILYLVGRVDEAYSLLGLTDPLVIEDQGAIIHCDFTEFQDGFHRWLSSDYLFDGEIKVRTTRFAGIHLAELDRRT